MDVAEILDQASKIVDEAWCQGSMNRFAGIGKYAYCAVGAMQKVALDDVMTVDQIADYREALVWFGAHIGDPYIPEWNDTEGRTADEVSTAMRDAAREWRAAH